MVSVLEVLASPGESGAHTASAVITGWEDFIPCHLRHTASWQPLCWLLNQSRASSGQPAGEHCFGYVTASESRFK